MQTVEPGEWFAGMDSDDAEAQTVADRIGRYPTPAEMRALYALTDQRRNATGASYTDAWKEALAMTYPEPTEDELRELRERDAVPADELRQLRAAVELADELDELDDDAVEADARAAIAAGQIAEARERRAAAVAECRAAGCHQPKRGGRGRVAPYCVEHGSAMMRVASEAGHLARYGTLRDDAHQEQTDAVREQLQREQREDAEPIAARSLEVPRDEAGEPWTLAGFLARCQS